MAGTLVPVGILGTGAYLPEKIVTNNDIAKIIETNDEWIISRTGIKERRICDEHTATSDLALEAAKRALEDAGVKAEDLDLIVLGTSTPDNMLFPATACLIQAKLGAHKAAAFDLSIACSGFVYSLITASQFVATGAYKRVLVIGADTLSKNLNWEDRSTCILFGDGAGAVVLGPVEEGNGLLSFELGAQGDLDSKLIVPAGGSRTPLTAENISNRKHFIEMAGPEVYKFAVKIMGEAAARVIDKAGLSLEDIDYFVPHQANNRIIEAAAKRLKLSKEKVFKNVEKYGNTSAASVPVALDEAVKGGKIKKGDNIILVGFGAGLAWAAATIRWSK